MGGRGFGEPSFCLHRGPTPWRRLKASTLKLRCEYMRSRFFCELAQQSQRPEPIMHGLFFTVYTHGLRSTEHSRVHVCGLCLFSLQLHASRCEPVSCVVRSHLSALAAELCRVPQVISPNAPRNGGGAHCKALSKARARAGVRKTLTSPPTRHPPRRHKK